MQARLDRQDEVVLGLLTDALRSTISTGSTSVPVFQVSNPCWYRYEVLEFDRPTSTTALARVRIYEHFWAGDSAGGPPSSWEQELELIQTAAGWRIDRLGPLQKRRIELKEPHGPNTSACKVAR
jgi:hypothetical protein